MTHTHVHSDHSDGILWIDPHGELKTSNNYAQHHAQMFGRSGLKGQELLNLIIQKLDHGLMVGTHECDDDSHLPLPDAGEDSSFDNVDPAPDDNWQKYEGEDAKHHHDIQFSNDSADLA